MPTKERRAREKAKAKEKAWLSTPPDYAKLRPAKGATSGLFASLDTFAKDNPEVNLRGGLLVVTEDGFSANTEAQRRGQLASKRNSKAVQARNDKALDMRARNSDIWGQHGKANIIQKREKVLAPDKKLSIRTIQKYIQDFPLK